MNDHWLVVGLGNPGPKYATTRHNVGYLVSDVLLGRAGARLTSHKAGRIETADVRLGDAKVTLARPRTYMNEVGAAVGPLASFYKLVPGQLVVVHDELDLDFGQLRIKRGGGNGGHNGLRSIQASLGSAEFYRVRVGIGRPPGRQDAASFVLAPFSSVQRKELQIHVEEAADAVESLIENGLTTTQNAFNR